MTDIYGLKLQQSTANNLSIISVEMSVLPTIVAMVKFDSFVIKLNRLEMKMSSIFFFPEKKIFIENCFCMKYYNHLLSFRALKRFNGFILILRSPWFEFIETRAQVDVRFLRWIIVFMTL